MDVFADPNYANQTAIFDPASFGYTVNLIGCGGIGATIAPVLASLGIRRWRLWDPDLVESTNAPMSLSFGPEDVGLPKVERLSLALQRLSVPADSVVTHQRLFGPDDRYLLDGIVISAVDNMAARHMIWQTVKDAPLVPLLLDGRVGGWGYTLCTIDVLAPNSDDVISWYEERQLFSDANAAPLPCTGDRGWIGPAAMLGPIMATQIVQWFTNEQPLKHFISDDLRGLTPVMMG